MPSYSNDPVVSASLSTNAPAVTGEGHDFEGVRGISHNEHGAVVGINDYAPASPPGAGGNGAWFESAQGEGVRGQSKTQHHGGVVGVNTAGGWGVYGVSDGHGVVGECKVLGAGVYGLSVATGVIGESKTWHGVYGKSESTTGGAGVWGEAVSGVGVYGKGRLAGFFEGDVEVTGDVRLRNADCAEDFNIGTEVSVEPGTVMVLGEEGALFPSHKAYDKRVAGVISGAGDFKPGIVLDKQSSKSNRQPVALLGKVYCKVDAQYGAVEVGDLLTTAPTPGHAMKADDVFKAFGAVIGKALRPLKEGQGLIPILIALQ